MVLNFKVKASEIRGFNPTELQIFVGDRFEKDGATFVNVATELKETFEGGYTLQYADHVMPESVLAIINGFDVNTSKPTVNKEGLNQLLQTFKLSLHEETNP
jgi:hypothetical protein